MTRFPLKPYFPGWDPNTKIADWLFGEHGAARFSSSLFETPEEYELKVDLPGVKQEDVEVELNDGVLAVRGERKEEIKHKTYDALVSERSFGRFTRQFSLASPVNEDTITAVLKDGVLTVRLAKKSEAQKGKTITVTT